MPSEKPSPRYRICLVNSALKPVFHDLGHEVLELHPKPGICHLPRLLAKYVFEPNVVIQQETLGPRILLRGLESLPCIKIYWSIDTHLNAFWQEEYARLFDMTCSTQKQLVRHLHSKGIGRTAWLPWYGRRMPWVPWSRRRHAISFVGRVTEHRPSRQRFVAFLQSRFNLELFQDVPFQQMLDIYLNTRLAPNESICGEINFRLFEAASCGCLVLNSSATPGLEDLFTPEREIAVFGHALDLSARINQYMNTPDVAEKMAKAAWARVQEEHLPTHRAQTLLNLINETRSVASIGRPDSSAQVWALTLYRLWQAKRGPILDDDMNTLLLALPESPEKRSALMGFWVATGNLCALRHGLAGLLQTGLHAGMFAVDQTASMAALHLGDMTTATAFWLRFRTKAGSQGIKPQTPLELYEAWARELQRRNRLTRPGLLFDFQRHLPESTLECLIMAHRLDPRNMDICRRMDSLLDKQPGFEPLRLSLLSHLTLHLRQDWLAGMKLGLVNLQGFRLEQGLEEIMLAEHRAGKQGESRKFLDALAVIDPKGLIRQALAPRTV